MIKEKIKSLIEGKTLDFSEMQEVFHEITDGKATDAQIAAFLTALRTKGETVSDIVAAVSVMKDKSVRFNTNCPETIDIVGTGGDCTGTFNISTAAAFIAAGAGCKVAKHGNRSVSSKSGAADVLEALGININLTPEQSLEIFRKTGICFMFAQLYHPCMKYVANVRHEIGIRTIFNILGPLINPANTKRQLIGVYDESLVEPIAKVLVNLGTEAGMVLHGDDGLDEATITSPTTIAEIKNSKIDIYKVNPTDYALKVASLENIKGGNAKENAQIILNIFSGKEKSAKRDIAVLNAGLAIYLTGHAKSIKEGVELAQTSIDKGLALKELQNFIELTNKISEVK